MLFMTHYAKISYFTYIDLSKGSMKKNIFVWTGVNLDGTGDFRHCHDLVTAIQAHSELNKLYDLTVVIVIGCKDDILNKTWEKHSENLNKS